MYTSCTASLHMHHCTITVLDVATLTFSLLKSYNNLSFVTALTTSVLFVDPRPPTCECPCKKVSEN